MKRLIIIALVLSSLLQACPQLRVADVEVESVNREYGTVSFVDTDGEVWVAEVDNISKYSLGDGCTLVYDTMGTGDIYDDEIVAIVEMEVLHG